MMPGLGWRSMSAAGYSTHGCDLARRPRFCSPRDLWANDLRAMGSAIRRVRGGQRVTRTPDPCWLSVTLAVSPAPVGNGDYTASSDGLTPSTADAAGVCLTCPRCCLRQPLVCAWITSMLPLRAKACDLRLSHPLRSTSSSRRSTTSLRSWRAFANT
jgi:hypothetical protein